MFVYCCCNACEPTVTVPKWLNTTQVRKAAFTNGEDASGGLDITNVAPFSRLDSGQYAIDNDPDDCTDLPPGDCGTWLVAGDHGGLSAQEVEDTVNDIMACGDTLRDLNCYQESGTQTFDHGKHGGKWVLARKFWHGAFGFLETDGYEPNANASPAQTKYRTVTHVTEECSSISTFIDETGTYVWQRFTDTGAVVRTVNRLTGVITQSGAELTSKRSTYNYTGTEGGVVGDGAETVDYDRECPDTDNLRLFADVGENPNGLNDMPGIEDLFGTAITAAIAAGFDAPTKTPAGWTFDADYDVPETTTHVTLHISVVRTNTSYTWDCSNVTLQDDGGGRGQGSDTVYKGSVTLSDPYTAADCYADWLAAIDAWSMKSDAIYPFRTDEQLANSPMCCYDEAAGAVSPIGFNCPVDDYSATKNEDDTWPQRDWFDPSGSIWQFPNGSYTMPEDFTGGATLITGLLTGAIISHNPGGSERHFWFNALNQRRDSQIVFGSPTGMFIWVDESHGAFSASPLPASTLRWMDRFLSQYDGLAFTNDIAPPTGNFPQAFLREKNGALIGGKYVECMEVWPRVNFARPCGPDKYAVDQTTVCCVLSTGTDTLTVRATGDAILPLETGGLTVGDTIIRVGDGVYSITSIDDDGTVSDWHQFTLHLSAKIDDLPTGGIVYDDARDDMDWVGRARWWNNDGKKAPGICGRVAVTTSFSDPTLTITAGAAQPFLRTGEVVDICNASMSVLATVTLTRTSDTVFTTTHADVTGAAWMVAHVFYDGTTAGATNYQWNDTTPDHTFVHLEWSLQNRIGDTPPTWYADIEGCLSLTVDQSSLAPDSCYPSVIGVVPSAVGIDDFSHKQLYGFPSTFTVDDVYGAVWQAAVESTMTDPFWQQPFKPDCDVVSPDIILWRADDGSGQADSEELSEGGATIYHRFFAAAPLVEALKSYPSGAPTLPDGISLGFDTAHNDIAPPYYPNGIPIGDDSGNYASVWRPWGFRSTACATISGSGRFASDYSDFVSCEE